jgi:hypothetical protein
MESEDKTVKTWLKIYPSYIDKEIKHSEGRKVSLPYAVDKPSAQEIFLICQNLLKLPCKLEYVSILIYIASSSKGLAEERTCVGLPKGR